MNEVWGETKIKLHGKQNHVAGDFVRDSCSPPKNRQQRHYFLGVGFIFYDQLSKNFVIDVADAGHAD